MSPFASTKSPGSDGPGSDASGAHVLGPRRDGDQEGLRALCNPRSPGYGLVWSQLARLRFDPGWLVPSPPLPTKKGKAGGHPQTPGMGLPPPSPSPDGPAATVRRKESGNTPDPRYGAAAPFTLTRRSRRSLQGERIGGAPQTPGPSTVRCGGRSGQAPGCAPSALPARLALIVWSQFAPAAFRPGLGPPLPIPQIGREKRDAYGLMFWFMWKTLPGSYFFLMETRRS